MLPPAAIIQQNVATALAEDIGDGDVTASLIGAETVAAARVICRQQAVLCGRAWFDETLRQVDGDASVRWAVDDGASVAPNDTVCRLEGRARSLLTAERTALNFLQLLSGVASETARYVAALQGSGTRILDTRKTIPGLRHAQKYAVACGGGTNHRMGLFDAVLIKENHIAAAGSITAAIQQARQLAGDRLVEVEVENLQQLEEALAASPDRIMLDNFGDRELAMAVATSAGRVELEASGGVELERIAALAATGIDYISVGALTKHIRATDFSMRFESS